MLKIAVIGAGHVGLVTGLCFAHKGHKVICVDNDAKKISSLKKGKLTFYEPGLAKLLKTQYKQKKRISFSTSIKEALNNSEVIFIAVGTPLADNGSADLSYVKSVSHEIAKSLTDYKVIIEKSTVPVQTGQRIKKLIQKYAPGKDFDMVANPEFLQEGKALQTTLHPDRIVVGVETKRAEIMMKKLYSSFKVPLIITNIESAEIIKHASNSFLAMKISYINALARICELSGADVDEVAYGIGLDKRIGKDFLKAGIGYGGYCLPKDVPAFAYISKHLGYKFGLLHEIQKINTTQRDFFINKIRKEMGGIKGKKIGVLGISFKPDTDDTRESPAVAVIEKLLSLGAKIKAFDPQVKKIPITKKYKSNFSLSADIYQTAKNADCLVILTDWSEFKKINLARIKKILAKPIIIDGRNMFDKKKMNKIGLTYRSVGRK